MYVAESKRLTHQGAKKMMATAINMANEAGIAICCAIVDAGGYMMLLERMDGGRFHTVHSCTTRAVCAASNRRPTTAKGTAGQDLDVRHAIGLALAAGPERWTANVLAASGSAAATGKRICASPRRLSSRLG